jgi:hypothetical protein
MLDQQKINVSHLLWGTRYLCFIYLPIKSSLPGSSSYTSNSTESVADCSTTNSNTLYSKEILSIKLKKFFPHTSFHCGSFVLLIVFVLYSTLP